jgi:hypothetical protein
MKTGDLAYIHNGILFNSFLSKEGNPVTCDNMSQHGGHYAIWNKPGSKRQTLLDHTCGMQNKLIGCRKVFTTGSGWRRQEDAGQRAQRHISTRGTNDVYLRWEICS